ncbi:MAG: hypothetical protein WCJ13_04335 [Coriobacteriia bacterium]
MSKAGRSQVGKKVLVSVLLICVALLAVFAAGCSKGGAGDQKAMVEAVAKFYAAQGALDLATMKATIYDPQNMSGIATATIPADAKKTEIVWKSVGDTVLITVPSQELTLTASVAKTPANAVLVADPSGQGETLIMKKDGGVWKIDFAETQKASAAKAAAPSPQSAPAPSGQSAPSGTSKP